MRKLLFLFGILVSSVMFFSCENKTFDELTPEQQQKEYAQFQKDSVTVCTQNEYLAKTLVNEAFDRGVYYSKNYKKTKTNVEFNDELQGWVGTVDYNISHDNMFTQGTKVYHLFIWYENNGFAKDGKIFYKITQVSGDK